MHFTDLKKYKIFYKKNKFFLFNFVVERFLSGHFYSGSIGGGGAIFYPCSIKKKLYKTLWKACLTSRSGYGSILCEQ